MRDGKDPVMSIGPKTRRLIDGLESLASLLRGHGEPGWADWLEKDAERIRSGDLYGVKHLLSAFGGMGSLGDLWLCPESGHKIAQARVAAANEELRKRLGLCWELADWIRRNADVRSIE
jgi:hypothetical protein